MHEIVNTRGQVLFGMIWAVMMVLSSLVYLVSPFDLVPECIFGLIGLIDDIAYIIGALVFLANSYNQILVQRNQQAIHAR